jgi:hypothetical protein
MRDSLKDARIKALAAKSQQTPLASLYYFEASGSNEVLTMNDSWRAFMMENMGIVQSFAEYHFALYLQARNPNVPGVVNKLRSPTARQLTTAREFWGFVRDDLKGKGKTTDFRDIYSGDELRDRFSIDHFLPWSFVVHGLLWNLAPVEPATNSSKGDALPDIDLYLPRLARLHFAAMGAARRRPKFLEDYTDCFKEDAANLLALGEDGFISRYRQIIIPQAQIAVNQGFESGWKLRS